ncbi:MAG TPA: EAL domain-containing protein [Acidimicrobiales bacterium]|nr:EAL domain-containing protein [Acidimicrobiales bacterium]
MERALSRFGKVERRRHRHRVQEGAAVRVVSAGEEPSSHLAGDSGPYLGGPPGDVRLQAALLDAVGQAVMATDPAGVVIYWNRAAERHYGWSSTQAVGQRVGDLIASEESIDQTEAIREAVGRGETWSGQYMVTDRDGHRFPVYATITPVFGADGSVVAIIGVSTDVSELDAGREAQFEGERVRRAAETRFEIGFEQAAVGAVIADLEGYPVRVNPAYCTLLGRPADLLVGRRWTDSYHPEEAPLRPAMMARVAAGHDTYEDERRFLRPDGSLVWGRCQAVLVRDGAGDPLYFFIQVQDITERKLAEQELGHQLAHDSLTGLPNRTLLADRLVYGLAGAQRRDSKLGVFFLDIDHLKAVNDTFGHAFGDALLRHTADRIAGAIRPGDTVARFSGDEFVVVCDDVGAAEAEDIATRVLHALGEPCVADGHAVTVSASIGVVLSDASATPGSVLQDAGAAMNRAKERGRGRVELFDELLRAKSASRLSTTLELRQALEQDEFVVYYQPIVDVATGAVVSAEALLRWQHPDRGMVSPLDFIPLAEESGLIVPIGAWVLDQACRQLAEWQRSHPDMSVAVNLSVRQASDPGVTELLADVLKRTGVAPGGVCLELTESLLMDDVDYFGRTLALLKTLGVRLSIDDFGTGYSSLSYLKRFPFDAVKVDRAFVDGLGTDAHDTALVAAIVAMAGALDLGVVAEGVETAEQLDHLRALHCQRAQGFHIAKPMPEDAMIRFLADSGSRLAAGTGARA